MIVKTVRIWDVEIPDTTPKEDVEQVSWDRLDVDRDLVGEYIYPEGKLKKEMLREIKETL